MLLRGWTPQVWVEMLVLLYLQLWKTHLLPKRKGKIEELYFCDQ